MIVRGRKKKELLMIDFVFLGPLLKKVLASLTLAQTK